MATLHCVRHPHHVSLVRQPFTIQSMFHSFADRVDPYYEYDNMPSHKGLYVPRFNVTETETNFILDGELPGVMDKSSVEVMWLQNQVLIISGVVKPANAETAVDPFEKGLLENRLPPPTEPSEELPPNLAKVQIEVSTKKQKVEYPRQLLRERRIGQFQRSFTFPDDVDVDKMKANLKDGLLTVVVPKKTKGSSTAKAIRVE